MGYPRLFNGRDCSWLTWFSSGEMSALNATADLLNSRLSAAAGAAGFAYANPTNAFLGHAVCDSQEWINNLSLSITESFHPKRVGHASGYYPTVNPLVTAPSLRAASPALTAAVLARAADLGRRPRRRGPALRRRRSPDRPRAGWGARPDHPPGEGLRGEVRRAAGAPRLHRPRRPPGRPGAGPAVAGSGDRPGLTHRAPQDVSAATGVGPPPGPTPVPRRFLGERVARGARRIGRH
ncbi:MAG: hypothetical protein R2731_06880 [Nocardioides sp.]